MRNIPIFFSALYSWFWKEKFDTFEDRVFFFGILGLEPA